jgi:hypothetical protein
LGFPRGGPEFPKRGVPPPRECPAGWGRSTAGGTGDPAGGDPVRFTCGGAAGGGGFPPGKPPGGAPGGGVVEPAGVLAGGGPRWWCPWWGGPGIAGGGTLGVRWGSPDGSGW